MSNEQEKKLAAQASLKFVRDGDVVGLGTGSTAAYFIAALSEQVRKGLRVRGVPTSNRSAEQAQALGISLATLEDCPKVDIAVDGADEIDSQLRLIKGGGGALLREKIVASAAKQYVVIADSSKRVEHLGKFPLPVEVIKCAHALVAGKIEGLGAKVRLRHGPDGKRFLSDENNYILDCAFGEIADPERLARQLADMPGVVEHGLFIGFANLVLVGKRDDVLELRPPQKSARTSSR